MLALYIMGKQISCWFVRFGYLVVVVVVYLLSYFVLQWVHVINVTNKLKIMVFFTNTREKENLRLNSRSQSDGFPEVNTQDSKQKLDEVKNSKVQMFKCFCWSPHKGKKIQEMFNP